jgi:hypothetical protein
MAWTASSCAGGVILAARAPRQAQPSSLAGTLDRWKNVLSLLARQSNGDVQLHRLKHHSEHQLADLPTDIEDPIQGMIA